MLASLGCGLQTPSKVKPGMDSTSTKSSLQQLDQGTNTAVLKILEEGLELKLKIQKLKEQFHNLLDDRPTTCNASKTSPEPALPTGRQLPAASPPGSVKNKSKINHAEIMPFPVASRNADAVDMALDECPGRNVIGQENVTAKPDSHPYRLRDQTSRRTECKLLVDAATSKARSSPAQDLHAEFENVSEDEDAANTTYIVCPSESSISSTDTVIVNKPTCVTRSDDHKENCPPKQTPRVNNGGHLLSALRHLNPPTATSAFSRRRVLSKKLLTPIKEHSVTSAQFTDSRDSICRPVDGAKQAERPATLGNEAEIVTKNTTTSAEQSVRVDEISRISRSSRTSLREQVSSNELLGAFHSTFSYPLHSTMNYPLSSTITSIIEPHSQRPRAASRGSHSTRKHQRAADRTKTKYDTTSDDKNLRRRSTSLRNKNSTQSPRYQQIPNQTIESECDSSYLSEIDVDEPLPEENCDVTSSRLSRRKSLKRQRAQIELGSVNEGRADSGCLDPERNLSMEAAMGSMTDLNIICDENSPPLPSSRERGIPDGAMATCGRVSSVAINNKPAATNSLSHLRNSYVKSDNSRKAHSLTTSRDTRTVVTWDRLVVSSNHSKTRKSLTREEMKALQVSSRKHKSCDSNVESLADRPVNKKNRRSICQEQKENYPTRPLSSQNENYVKSMIQSDGCQDNQIRITLAETMNETVQCKCFVLPRSKNSQKKAAAKKMKKFQKSLGQGDFNENVNIQVLGRI